MERNILPLKFFRRPTLIVAQELLGKFLVCQYEGREIGHMITEVEAYDGFEDQASHAHKGKTERNAVMFGEAGKWYVYLVYGMYNMLNIVTGEDGYPAAILIRGLERIDGPGRLTRALNIDKRFNALPSVKMSGLWIEDRGVKIAATNIHSLPRIGVEYAGPHWSKVPYRFLLKNL